MRALARRLAALLHAKEGVAMIEFAIALPVLLTLALGSVEIGRYILLNQKLENATSQIADLFTREETISSGEIDGLFAAVGNIVDPFPFAAEGVVIVSAVGEPSAGAGAQVLWQAVGAGSLVAASEIGSPGGSASLPAGLDVRPDQTVVVAELFFRYSAILGAIVPDRILRKTAFYRPRLSLLDSLEGGA